MESLVTNAKTLLNLTLTADQIAAFEHYATELTAWNEKHNLTAIIDPQGILIRHFLDSLSCLLAMRTESGLDGHTRLIDVGTGAGFPGLPLKIVCPQIELTLIESIGKKCDFLRHISQELNLEGVKVLECRAEELGQSAEHREQYDWALARAVARMPTLLEYLLPLVRVGGCCIAQKGETGHTETQEAVQALSVLGGQVRSFIPVELPGVAETRYLVTVEKVSATPDKYPRRPGIPHKRPLLAN